MQLCDYGCGQEAIYQFKNGKWCCSESHNRCPVNRSKNTMTHLGEKNYMYGKDGYWLNKKFSEEHIKNISKVTKGKNHPNYGKKRNEDICKKISVGNKGKKRTREQRKKSSLINKKTLNYFKKRYSLFSKIEEMRYNPDKPGEKEIQVHCKNHTCKNSKEQVGWFTPTYIQLYERIRQVERGNGGCYFYCSDKCKNECPLFNLQSDPYKKVKKLYTSEEYQQFRNYALERDNYKCQYCGEKAEYVHHERPQKLEPFFALDPDYALSVCKKCHYEKGHSDEFSTGNLANIICT